MNTYDSRSVFDRDDHATYYDALSVAATLDGTLRNDAKQPVIFKAVASVPSFELWLLLHFEDIKAPLPRDEVLSRLKTHIPGYQKGDRHVFAKTRGPLSIATTRAELLAAKFTPYTDPEPYTAVVNLVTLLTSLSLSS